MNTLYLLDKETPIDEQREKLLELNYDKLY